MRRMRRSIVLLSTILSLALVAAGCGDDDEESGGGGDSSTLIDLQNFGVGGPDKIDPGLARDVNSSQPGYLAFDGLMENDPETMELKPMVAEAAPEVNEDNTEFTFTLRDDVTWHDGEPVKPSDFEFAWKRVLDPEFGSPVSYHLYPIEGAEAMNAGEGTELGVVADDEANTLTVTTEYAYSLFPRVTTHLVFSPVPKHIVEKLDDQTTWEDDTMVGNGPYKFTSGKKTTGSIKMERYDDYWGGLADKNPEVKTIEFRISEDETSAYGVFEGGTGHVALIPEGRLEEVKEEFGDRVIDDPLLAVNFYGFNMKSDAVGGEENLELRQAIGLALDKETAITASFGEGARKVPSGYVPEGMPGYEAVSAEFAAAPEQNLDRAKELMEEWGGDPPTLSILIPEGSGHDTQAETFQANLEEIGVTVTIDPLAPETFFGRVGEGNYDIFWAGWVADFPHYDNLLYSSFVTDNGDNLTGYSNPEYDAKLLEARSEPDEDKAIEMYREAEEIMLADVPVIPLDWGTNRLVISDKVDNFVVSKLGLVAYELATLG